MSDCICTRHNVRSDCPKHGPGTEPLIFGDLSAGVVASKLGLDPQQQVMLDVMEERDRQDMKWGEQNHDGLLWGMILGEEVGEATRQVLFNREAPYEPGTHDDMRDQYEVRVAALRSELVQVAAVAVAWIESLDREMS